MSRAQRDRLATALRQFGLTDRFELHALLEAGRVPSAATIRRRLAQFPEGLPAGVTATYLAAFIAETLQAGQASAGGVSVELLSEDADVLRAIPNGARKASTYQRQIFRILSGAFDGRLVEGRMEARHDSGRKRLDIRYRNADRIGFFCDLIERHGIKAPWIIVECKNYTDDPDNAEYDQLAGRMRDEVGVFGIMAVRQINDAKRMEEYRLHRRNAGRFLLVLDDDDMVAILTAHLAGDEQGVDAVLRRKLETLLVN
jgi:hypothetical protein